MAISICRMFSVMIFALCVCGCVQGAAIQGQKADFPTYKLVGKVGSLELRKYDPMTLVRQGVDQETVDQKKVEQGTSDQSLDNIDSFIQTGDSVEQADTDTIELSSILPAVEGKCHFPFHYFGRWFWGCRYKRYCVVDQRKRLCTSNDKKVTVRQALQNMVDILIREGYPKPIVDAYRNQITIIDQIAAHTGLLSLDPSDPEKVVTSYVVHPNYATQIAQHQNAPASLIQYPSTTILVKRLVENEGNDADGQKRISDQVESALDEASRQGFDVQEVMLAVHDKTATREAVREIWFL